MKIRTLLFALTLVVVPATAQAQVTDDYVMNISGTIASNVTASVLTPMAFGAITAGTQIATGQFQVLNNQPVGVGVVVTNLTNSNDGTEIVVTPTCRKGASFAGGVDFISGCTGDSLDAGTNNVWVRGAITPGVGATAGIYAGTATMTLSYVSF